MSQHESLSRRGFLRAAAMSAVGMVAASCAQPTAQVIEKEVPVQQIVKETVVVEKQVPIEKVVTATPVPSKFKEPPMLAGFVQAGTLPPVDERVGDEPMVVTPLDSIGQYGGELHQVGEITRSPLYLSMFSYHRLVRWSIMGTEMEPNVAKAWEVSADSKDFTFFLRKGMRWSDGEPFTADDFEFYFNDMELNTDLQSRPSSYLTAGGEPFKFEKIDDYSFSLHFAAPNGMLINMAAFSNNWWRAKHYLSQFHADYVPKAELDAKVKAAGFETWDQLFGSMNRWYDLDIADHPCVLPWYPTVDKPSTRYVFKRNPYYWKVDTEGNQLPYIDEYIITVMDSAETAKIKVLAGGSDLQYKALALQDYPVLKENEERGGYRTLLWPLTFGSNPAIFPNQNAADPVMNELIADDRFRIALSHAINRDQINEMVFLGLGKGRAATTPESSPIYKPEYGEAYADYDPAKANALLDELGLDKRDSEGFRLRKDGETLFCIVEVLTEEPYSISQIELVKEYWQDVGVKTEVVPEERGLLRNRVASGEATFVTWQYAYVFSLFNPVFTVPSSTGCYWAPQYSVWYTTEGQEGVEPTGDIRKLQQIWDVLKETADPDQQIKLSQDIFDLHAQHCWLIGLVGELPQPIVISQKLRNCPEVAICSTIIGRYLGSARLEQLYFEGGTR